MPNVRIIKNAQTTEVLGAGGKVVGLNYKDRSTDELKKLDLDGIFVQIGLVPNTEFLKGSVELSDRGEIVINDRGETSMAGVFAAGDATTTPFSRLLFFLAEVATVHLSAFIYLFDNY